MPKKESRRTRLQRFLQERSLTHVDEPAWRLIRGAFPDDSPSALRHALRKCPVSVDPPYAGVDQIDLDSLEHTLVAIAAVYQAAKQAGRPDKSRLCRDVVIEAKDHARLASHNSRVTEQKRVIKQEMVEWMLVWLDDPAMFASWVELRKAARQ